MEEIIGKFCINKDAVEEIIDFDVIEETLIEATTQRELGGSIFKGEVLIYVSEIYETEIDAYKGLIERLEGNLEFAKMRVKKLELEENNEQNNI